MSHTSHPVLEKCPVLREYSEFVEHVRAYGNDEKKLTKAVKECIREGFLSEKPLKKWVYRKKHS